MSAALTPTGERGTETRPGSHTNTRFLQGDSHDVLKTLPSGSVHAIVTSPPYWSLRDYGRAGQIGRESSVDAYVSRLVQTFREARRVLRDDGSCWMNLGDAFATGKCGPGIKKKDLVGLPWLVAFALRADGWHLRCDIVWHKSNGTPESVRDRPSRCHEYLFLLTKREKYFYDREAVREPNEGKPPSGRKAALLREAAKRCQHSANKAHGGKWAANKETHAGFAAWNPRGRNLRTVWKTPVSCFRPETVGIDDVTHFAVFPPKLIRPCILASTSAAGCCPVCGAPYGRIVASYEDLEDTWVPSCGCPPADPVPCTVLDFFGGSGTTAVVAKEEGRSAILIDLNADYLRLARARVAAAKGQ